MFASPGTVLGEAGREDSGAAWPWGSCGPAISLRLPPLPARAWPPLSHHRDVHLVPGLLEVTPGRLGRGPGSTHRLQPLLQGLVGVASPQPPADPLQVSLHEQGTVGVRVHRRSDTGQHEGCRGAGWGSGLSTRAPPAGAGWGEGPEGAWWEWGPAGPACAALLQGLSRSLLNLSSEKL